MGLSFRPFMLETLKGAKKRTRNETFKFWVIVFKSDQDTTSPPVLLGVENVM